MQASTSTLYRPVSSTCLSRGRCSMSLQPPNGQEHPLGADKIEAPVNATQRTGASFMPHGGRGETGAALGHDIGLPSRLATLSFGHVAGLIQHHVGAARTVSRATHSCFGFAPPRMLPLPGFLGFFDPSARTAKEYPMSISPHPSSVT